jgi:transaldolase
MVKIMNFLEQLRKVTTVVADSGDIEAIKKFTPTDATTNPSLILQAASMPEYRHLIEEAIAPLKKSNLPKESKIQEALDLVFVIFGKKILEIVPGRVSTEIDARLSFDTLRSVEKARHIIKLYESMGIDKKRVLIKLASTWEGIKAAEILEKEGIHCNMTLIFSIAQAVACAHAKATLISPFVGRILDWYKKSTGKEYTASEDPGVVSVTEIFNYYKHYGIKTQVMGASFRTADEVLELAGCDLLTIAPKLLDEIVKREGTLTKKLDESKAKQMGIAKLPTDEASFRWMMNDNAMATEKLAEGIRNFAIDSVKLEKLIESML